MPDTDNKNQRIRRLLDSVTVLPVLSLGDPGIALELVAALADGGLTTVEITLRTDRAMEVVRRVVEEFPEIVVGVGTVVDESQLTDAEQVGAQFAVSPGLDQELLLASQRCEMPLIPGVATVSEAMTARRAGFQVLKLFPAKVLGGIGLLRAIRGPLPELLFCPTGGIDSATYRGYLEEPNVVCVGGSWMVPKDLVENRNWAAITRQAREILS